MVNLTCPSRAMQRWAASHGVQQNHGERRSAAGGKPPGHFDGNQSTGTEAPQDRRAWPVRCLDLVRAVGRGLLYGRPRALPVTKTASPQTEHWVAPFEFFC